MISQSVPIEIKESGSGIIRDDSKKELAVPSGVVTADSSFMNVIMQGTLQEIANKPSTAQYDEIITHFVSKSVRDFCKQNVHLMGDDNIMHIHPQATDSFAAVVMVDVSGYSKLTAALAERGPVGAELLSKTMKGYLDEIIKIIVSYGGDIIKFAGDAVIVAWKSSTAINMTDHSEDVERGELVYKASHCCLTLLTKWGNYDINIPDCATKTLRIHLGIGAGLISEIIVGGSPGRWEHLIAGDGINQLSTVLDLAKAGELALSHQALKWLGWVVDIRSLNLGNYDKKCIILTGLAKAERRIAEKTEKVTDAVSKITDEKLAAKIANMYKCFMDRTAMFKLQSDVHQSNLFQLDARLEELLNLTELRQITTIFIKIGSLQSTEADEFLEPCQNAIQAVQNALVRCDGSLRQFHVDDKGAVILCFFGLPPLAHENDSKLGISAGIEIREKFLDLFEEFAIGITTGVVSFGGVGAEGRAEYAVMGDAINMAARLMCHKEAMCGILCDQKTYNLCENDFEFEVLGETTVKGKSSPIAIFRPQFAILETEKKLNSPTNIQNSTILGRVEEKKAISQTLDQLSNAAEVNNLFFSAEGGQGLTSLSNYTKAEAIKQNCHFCTGKGVQIEKNNSFFVFKSLVCDMIQLLDVGAHNAFGQFKIPFQAQTGNFEVPAANANSTLMPDRKKKTVNKTLEVADNIDAKRMSYTIMEINENNEDEIFSLRYRMALDILDCNENQAALLELVTQTLDDDSDAIAQAHLKLHAKDLCDILTRLLNMLTANNKIIMMITEAHYLDSHSWDLILELAMACPRLAIFSFARPESNIENSESKRIYRLIEQLPRTKSLFVQGLNAQETGQLVLSTWGGSQVSSIDPKICDSIYKKTDGNPFFVTSLIIALKESGQWRVDNSGRLTTPNEDFDFDKLVLGYDNQSIVLAQFDRLDRNFQLFLKIASVLGLKFSLDDVFYFLTGVEDSSQKIDKKKYMMMLAGIKSTDKYGFLQKDSMGTEGAFFVFKSAVVQKCVYNMLVLNQKQQLHLLVAQYFERKVNEQNRNRLGLQILDHYMNASAAHQKKRIQYTQTAAKYFFLCESAGETIKYNKLLLEMLEGVDKNDLGDLTSLQIANCHRELGYALMMKEEYAEAEMNLLSSLKIMGHTFPATPSKMKSALKSLESKRKKLDKTFFKDRPVPQQEDYTQSYVAKKGASGYSLSNLVPVNQNKRGDGILIINPGEDFHAGSNHALPKLGGVSPAQQVIIDTRESLLKATQHALVTLAEVYLKRGNFNGHYYAVLLGLNIATEESNEGHMSRLFSLGALALKHSLIKASALPYQYMEAATSFDLRLDIHTSLQHVSCNATLLFLGGQLEACQNKLEVVSYLSAMAGDLTSRVHGLHLKCLVQTHSSGTDNLLNTAKELYSLSVLRESQIGQIWGAIHTIHALLGTTDSEVQEEIQTKLKDLTFNWSKLVGANEPCNLSLKILVISLQNFAKLYLKGEEPDVKEVLTQLLPLVTNVPFFEWQFFVGLNPLSLLILNAIYNTEIDPPIAKLIEQFCDATNKSLKATKGLALAGPMRRIFKGIKLVIKNKKNAVKAWRKGLGDQEEDIYTQAILLSAIYAAGEGGDDDEAMAEEYIKDLKARGRFQKIFSS